jgi:hypothetical protein
VGALDDYETTKMQVNIKRFNLATAFVRYLTNGKSLLAFQYEPQEGILKGKAL